MIKTGDYITYFYNKKGGKIKDLTEVTTQGLEDAKEMGEETIIIEEAVGSVIQPVSFSIDRRIYNSTDEKGTWE